MSGLRQSGTGLQIKGVSFFYKKRNVLNNIEFDIHPGEITALLGPNGAGKSTLLKIAAGLMSPREGELILDGTRIETKNQWLKSQIGYLSEHPYFYPQLSVREFIELVGHLRRMSGSELARSLDKWVEWFSLTEYLNYKMGQLSQGTRRRVSLTTVLLHEPYLLLLDEPTNGLDPEQIVVFRRALSQQTEAGKIVLISTHQLGLASQIAHNVVILRGGRLVNSGSSPKSDDLEATYLASMK